MDFLEALERFNRKERYFLVAYAPGKPAFSLDSGFANALGSAADLDVPPAAVGYMDYHLDWIQAAAHVAGPCQCLDELHENPEGDRRRNHGTQEDIDFVVAFREKDLVRVVMVEAKGEGAWDMAQLARKGRRLKAAFGELGTEVPGVVPAFVTASVTAPPRAVPAEWPAWMKGANGGARWLKLPWGADRIRVVGCNGAGLKSAERTHFMLRAGK